MLYRILKDLEEAEKKELARALDTFGEFSGRLEGWAKILEETEEADTELDHIKWDVTTLKQIVLHDANHEETESGAIANIRRHALLGAAELIQVAVVAEKYGRLLND